MVRVAQRAALHLAGGACMCATQVAAGIHRRCLHPLEASPCIGRSLFDDDRDVRSSSDVSS